MTDNVSAVALREELGARLRPINRLLGAVTGDNYETLIALIGLLDAARELASKVELPEDKLAVHRFKRALIDAEVAALGLERQDSERCWFGIGPDLAPLKGHLYQRVPGPIDQEHCELCLVMRHWIGARTEARYSWNGATYFDMPYGRTDEPPCGGKDRIKAWLEGGNG